MDLGRQAVTRVAVFRQMQNARNHRALEGVGNRLLVPRWQVGAWPADSLSDCRFTMPVWNPQSCVSWRVLEVQEIQNVLDYIQAPTTRQMPRLRGSCTNEGGHRQAQQHGLVLECLSGIDNDSAEHATLWSCLHSQKHPWSGMDASEHLGTQGTYSATLSDKERPRKPISDNNLYATEKFAVLLPQI